MKILLAVRRHTRPQRVESCDSCGQVCGSVCRSDAVRDRAQLAIAPYTRRI